MAAVGSIGKAIVNTMYYLIEGRMDRNTEKRRPRKQFLRQPAQDIGVTRISRN